MCNQHLLGEHVEIHSFVGTINKTRKLYEGYRGLVDVKKLWSRHEEIVEEMTRRGMNHNSPLPGIKPIVFESTVNVEESKKELMRRCELCRARFEKKERKESENEKQLLRALLE